MTAVRSTLSAFFLISMCWACAPTDNDTCRDVQEQEPNTLPAQAQQLGTGCTIVSAVCGNTLDTDFLAANAGVGDLYMKATWVQPPSQNLLEFTITDSSGAIGTADMFPGSDVPAETTSAIDAPDAISIGIGCNGPEPDQPYVVTVLVP